MKCVIILDPDLPKEVQINTAAGLGISLASSTSGLTGPEVTDAELNVYPGIVNVPVPILSLLPEDMKVLLVQIREKPVEGLQVFVFTDVAQRSLRYEDYAESLKTTRFAELRILGICLFGPRKAVNRLCGNLKSLR